MPYFRGGPLGVKVNLGSLVLVEGKAQVNGRREGSAGITATASDMKFTQGLGLSIANWSVEYQRNIQGDKSEDIVNAAWLGGILSAEYNFTTNELSIGMMPSASWALIFGVEGYVKQGVKFKF